MDTYLGALLKLYLRSDARHQQQVAATLGLHPSQLTRIISGQRVRLDHASLTALARAVSPDRDIQANLVVAYLLDQCPESFRAVITIESHS